MIDEALFGQANALIHTANKILVTTHVKPDGDAIGSLVGICNVLTQLGKQVVPLLLSPVPQWYQFLLDDAVPVLKHDLECSDLRQGAYADVDLIILVDVNSLPQLSHFGELLVKHEMPVLVIDHHATADHLGTVELVDPDAAATGLLVAEYIRYNRWPLSAKTAEALFVAAATDTGWFQFSSANSRVYRDCADLIDAGANPNEIYEKLFQDFSFAKFKLTLAMLDTLELFYHDQFAIQHLSHQDFERTGAAYEETENLINECHRIGSVKASALLVELPDGRIRGSLRSKSDLDVSLIARKFGGGGHKKAAGTFLDGPMEKARKTMIEEFKAFLA
ncbi:MAG: DHH family phosphoesterase [Phycisphaerae bacterium]|nr:DHH family phosphoesterase [Phycisphaerae bacterium]